MNTKIFALFAILTPVHPFSTPNFAQCRLKMKPMYAEGGADWIKDAMGGNEPKEPEFSQSEIDDMEMLIGKKIELKTKADFLHFQYRTLYYSCVYHVLR
jgi:hypothetical protein